MNTKEKAERIIERFRRKEWISATEAFQIYNEIHGTREKVSTCQSCILRKLRQIEKWLNE